MSFYLFGVFRAPPPRVLFDELCVSVSLAFFSELLLTELPIPLDDPQPPDLNDEAQVVVGTRQYKATEARVVAHLIWWG